MTRIYAKCSKTIKKNHRIVFVFIRSDCSQTALQHWVPLIFPLTLEPLYREPQISPKHNNRFILMTIFSQRGSWSNTLPCWIFIRIYLRLTRMPGKESTSSFWTDQVGGYDIVETLGGTMGNLNSLRPRPNRRHFADDIFKWIFFNENIWILNKISLKFVLRGPINNIPALVQIMAWRRPGDKPLSEPMMVSLLTHICVTRPQWVNADILRYNADILSTTLKLWGRLDENVRWVNTFPSFSPLSLHFIR